VRNAPILPSHALIAHLSDLHMLEGRPAQTRSVLELSMRFAAFGQALSPKARVARLAAALRAAQDAGAVHLVVTGDLTELGTTAQFEALAEVLSDARIDPDRVTLVPGNHDAYTRADAWQRALEGPLFRFRRSSACGEGSIVERARAFFLPVDVACHQHFTRAAGELTPRAADALEARVADLSGRGRPVVIVLHHSPIAHRPRAWQWLHGLRGGERILDLLARFPDVHVLHGHLHHEVELSLDARRPRIFGAPAVVDDPERAPRVRLYESAGSCLRSRSEPKRRGRGLLAA
jgi:Icc protein